MMDTEAVSTQAPQSMNWMQAVVEGGPIEIGVFMVLIIFSVAVLTIILERWREHAALSKRSNEFLKIFWDSKSMTDLHSRSRDMEYSPAREVFRTGYNEMIRVLQAAGKDSGVVPFSTVRRALSRAQGQEEVVLSKNLPFLAIAASACPFIGLFGTVVGIIRAFHDIGVAGSTSLAAVAPGISAALIATALGLVSAIPASIFFNVFQASARRHLALLEAFSADYLNILERHFLVGQQSQTDERRS